MGGDWTRSEPLSEINVVPLVDVLLVLLVIFMITAPIITHTLDVELPRASLSPGARVNQTFLISVDRKGQLAVNEEALGYYRDAATLKKLETLILEWRTENPDAPAFLRADRRLRYDTVIRIMAQLRRVNIRDVGLMIERDATDG